MIPRKEFGKKVLNFCFWFAALALAVNLGYKVQLPRKVKAQIAKHSTRPIPFTAVLRETFYDKDNKPTPTMTQTWAVRSDGARAFQVESNDRTNLIPGGTRQVDFVSGQNVRLAIFRDEKSTTFNSDSDWNNWVRTPSSDCMDSVKGIPMTADQVVAGHEIVDGFKTVKITLGSMSGWYALDYGCAPVKMTFDDGASGRSEQRLVSLIRGEPSATLFAIPNSFKEVPTSSVVSDAKGSSQSKAENKKDCKLSAEQAQRLDKEYYSHQSN